MLKNKKRIHETYRELRDSLASEKTVIGRHGLAYTQRSKSFRAAMRALILAALIACIIALSLNYKVVKLVIDGEELSQSTNTTSVAEVLAAANFDTHNVEISQPLDSEFKDNDTIIIKTPKTINVNVDGVDRTINTTAVTVDDLPEKLDLPEKIKISVPGDRKIKEFNEESDRRLEITTPKTVTIIADNSSQIFQSTAKTVGDVLKERGVVYSNGYRLSQGVDTQIVDGMALKLSRISTQEIDEKGVAIPFETEITKDPNMPIGSRKVLQEGRVGKGDKRVKLTSIDGKEISKTVTKDNVFVKPVSERITVGTKKETPKTMEAARKGSNYPQADGLNWAALAQCESGGRPNAVDSTGLYHGLYQFDVQTWRSVGGTGLPSQASPQEQTYRAQKLYQSRGRSPWPVCGRLL